MPRLAETDMVDMTTDFWVWRGVWVSKCNALQDRGHLTSVQKKDR